jgi:hypothetical protein
MGIGFCGFCVLDGLPDFGGFEDLEGFMPHPVMMT